MNLPLQVRVKSITWEAEGILSFDLRPVASGAVPDFTPGAHLDLALPNGMIRQYSLVNGAGEGRFVIAVSREQAGRGGSAHMHDNLHAGDLLEVTALRNNFPLDDGTGPVALIAGGIGITPLLAMARALAAGDRDWSLHYACRSRRHGAFLDELTAYGDRVHLHFDDEAGGPPDVAAWVSKAAADADLYCCGPSPMLDAFEAAAVKRPEGKVHLERFKIELPEGGDGDGFVVELARSRKTVQVPPDKSILAVVQAAGISAPHSCESGVCGTCETRVLEGIPDHKDQILDPSERASGRVMMICCSRAKSDKLVLDI